MDANVSFKTVFLLTNSCLYVNPAHTEFGKVLVKNCCYKLIHFNKK